MNGTRELRLQVPLLPGRIMSCESCTISAQVESSWDEILHVNVLDTLIQTCTRSTCTDEIPKNHSEASRGELKSGCTGGGRGKGETQVSCPRVTEVVWLGAEQGVKKGLIKEVICDLRQR